MHSRSSYVVGLIGADIGPSLSPALHEREAEELGLRYAYRRIDLSELGLDPAAVIDLLAQAREDGFAGVNITHPCKQVVVEHLDEVSPEASALGAVNTVVFEDDRDVGHNTDAAGFAQSFARGLPGAPTDRVVLVGAGGAGAAVAHAALGLGVGELIVIDTDVARARALTAGLDGAHAAPLDDLADALARADGVIHATPTGMAAHPGIAFPADLLHAGLWVAEVVYRPLETELLRHARAIGCRTLDGGGMAVFQAADAFALFTGVEPDRERMLRHFAELAEAPALAEDLA